MRRILKWLGLGVGGLTVLALGAAAFIYLLSERMIRKTYDLPLSTIAFPTDSVVLGEGQRLATVRSCYNGCHGEGLNGGVVVGQPLRAARFAIASFNLVGGRISPGAQQLRRSASASLRSRLDALRRMARDGISALE